MVRILAAHITHIQLSLVAGVEEEKKRKKKEPETSHYYIRSFDISLLFFFPSHVIFTFSSRFLSVYILVQGINRGFIRVRGMIQSK